MTAGLRSWLDSDLIFLTTTNVTSPSMKTKAKALLGWLAGLPLILRSFPSAVRQGSNPTCDPYHV
jgi:hypothetical protein